MSVDNSGNLRVRIRGSSSSSDEREIRNENDMVTITRAHPKTTSVPSTWPIPIQGSFIGASVFGSMAAPPKSRSRLQKRATASPSSRPVMTSQIGTTHSINQRSKIRTSVGSPASQWTHGKSSIAPRPRPRHTRNSKANADTEEAAAVHTSMACPGSNTRRTHWETAITIHASLKHPAVGTEAKAVIHATLGRSTANPGFTNEQAGVTIDALVESSAASTGNSGRSVRTTHVDSTLKRPMAGGGSANRQPDATLRAAQKHTSVGPRSTRSRGQARGITHAIPERPARNVGASMSAGQRLGSHPNASRATGRPTGAVQTLVDHPGGRWNPSPSLSPSQAHHQVSSRYRSRHSSRGSGAYGTYVRQQFIAFWFHPLPAHVHQFTYIPPSPATYNGTRIPGYFTPGHFVPPPVTNQVTALYNVVPSYLSTHGVILISQEYSWWWTSSPFPAPFLLPPALASSFTGFAVPGGDLQNRYLRMRDAQSRVWGGDYPTQWPTVMPRPPHADRGFIDESHLFSLDANFIISVRVVVSARAVDEWIGLHSAQDRKVFGFDLEWRPNQNMGDDNKAAVIQLAGVHGCLIVQLLYLDYVPESLRQLLADVNVKLAGVGVMADFHKLYRDYGIWCTGAVELGYLASHVLGKTYLRYVGLAELCGQVLQLQARFVKSKEVTLSDWAARALSRDQIRYAAADAFVAYRVLLNLKEKVSISGLHDYYGLNL